MSPLFRFGVKREIHKFLQFSIFHKCFSHSFLPGPGPEAVASIFLPSRRPTYAPRDLYGRTIIDPAPARPNTDKPLAVQLTWTALPVEKSNGPITGYAVYWRESLMEDDGEYERRQVAEPMILFHQVEPDLKWVKWWLIKQSMVWSKSAFWDF